MIGRFTNARLALGSVIIVCTIIAGCASSPGSKPKANSAGAGGGTTPISTGDGGITLPAVKHPPGTVGTVAVRAGVLPLGRVPYDNLSLPIISPDGQFIATQTGVPPTWSTVIAAPDSTVPELTRIDVYRLDRRGGIKEEERKEPALLFSLREPALLGRSCDTRGFLIESPRSDGSRWIGKASWSTGDIDWLVNDGHVNAFASLGLAGRLAWSRRTTPSANSIPDLSGVAVGTNVETPRFELVVRTTAGEWILPQTATEGDWLLPTWIGHADWMFVLHLHQETLDAVYVNASTASAFRQSLQKFQVVTASSVSTAYQMLSGSVNVADAAPPLRDQLVYFHPSLGRVAFWRPLGANGRKSMFLNPQSIAAILDEEDFGIVSTDKNLIRQRLSNYGQRINLVAGTVIPRTTDACEWPYALLAPLEGQVGITAMRLVPIDPKTPMGRVEP